LAAAEIPAYGTVESGGIDMTLPKQKPKAIKGYARFGLIWSAGCLTLIALVWSVTLTKTRSERAEAEKGIFLLATAHSRAYADQLARTLTQIEQLTLNLQYQWTKHGTAVNLEEQRQFGLFPRSGKIDVSIIDASGTTVTSTLSAPPVNAAEESYFKFHRTHVDRHLRVENGLIDGRHADTPLLRFTRRLEGPDGSFNGVVLVNTEPSFLASVIDESTLDPRDFISIRHEDGVLLVSEKGSQIRGLGQVHIEPPEFPAVAGARRIAGEHFKDGEARITAWQKHEAFQLVSYVGLAESTHLAAHLRTAREYRNFASAASGFLILFAIAGTYFSARHQRRKQQIEEVRAVFRLATDAANEGFYMVRPVYGRDGGIADFIYEDCNEHGARLLGKDKSQVAGCRLGESIPEPYREQVLSVYRQAMEEGFYEDEIRTAPHSPIKAAWLYRRLVRSGQALAVTLRDISEKKQHELMLMDLANTDSLTGLPNRHWLLQFLPEALNQAKIRRALLALLFIDLDGFKDINDSLGHSAGDRLLKDVAVRLKSLLRAHDHVVRLGGDEFTVLITHVASYEEVAQVAMRISHSFQEPFEISTHHGLVHCSIGIGVFPQDGYTTETLLQNADIAMYAAKEEGKGSFRFYDENLYDRLRQRLQTEDELTQAIRENQFVLHYQPRVESLSGRIAGMEVLVRWNHPRWGLVAPGEFIPLAESSGAIVPLGQIVLEKACEQMAQWRARGEPVVPVSINISARQFNAGGIDGLLSSLLKKHALPPDLIEVEITESAMMNESEGILEQVAAINAMNITIHVDDFGTGYSSLSRLQEFDMHVLKIDRAFTSRLGKGRAGEALFNSIVSMGKALDMRIIAEGVETREQLRLVQLFGCEEAQGFYISKPLPAEEALPLLRKKFLFPETVPPVIALI
jgi:diguanylate cyclase (GGDEF)-like protein